MDREIVRTEIDRLVAAGVKLFRQEVLATASPADKKRFIEKLADDPERDELLKAPNFSARYQAWYSSALRVVEQLLPDRYGEFRELYRNERRKTLDIETFGIADYIARIRPGIGFDPHTHIDRAINCFDRQIDILSTAASRLDPVLTDIGRALHAEILDNELDVARKLLGDGYTRPAGVVAGVALEGHLRKLIADHKVPFRKKAMLGNLNEALKNAGVYDVPQWRRIQHLTDVRNLCGHKSEREPKREEAEDLISETAKIIKTVF